MAGGTDSSALAASTEGFAEEDAQDVKAITPAAIPARHKKEVGIFFIFTELIIIKRTRGVILRKSLTLNFLNYNHNLFQGVIMPSTGEHNKWIALALCILVGYLGIHRFYEGKIWTGILWLCTGGLLGVGIVIDAILIILKPEHY